jgi:hypothetical protein
MSTMTAVNGAVIEFKLDRILSGRTTYTANLISGNWPGSEEIIELADGGGELAAYFGGRVEDTPVPSMKRITVHTQ